MVAGVEEGPQHRILPGEAAGEREAPLTALERRDALLERGAGRVGRPGVLVAAAQAADAVLLVRAHLVDRDARPPPSSGPAPGPAWMAREEKPRLLEGHGPRVVPWPDPRG